MSNSRILLIAIGKVDAKGLKYECDKLIARINQYISFSLLEIKEFGLDGKLEIEKEALKILEKTDDRSFKVALTDKGENVNSNEFFEFMDKRFVDNKSITFIIGGAFGLSSKIIKIADFNLALSSFTLTHQTARLVLLEQIYRWTEFKKGHPFVK
ncbi:MAG TPA: 23S rRNA (pseudouridine(1915)-N(3))-methyltransferase RlmH [Exilispira sp.]|nr:23S rRNA (pseudouridine(1915)-N(3))-methyltransferase RlmH [Exilispira sp.]